MGGGTFDKLSINGGSVRGYDKIEEGGGSRGVTKCMVKLGVHC